ncbi:rhodanese-like domain-containing protein [Ekhidna sp. MALMAid0563]|uniref:rhodanese-like domain-containing protein n=1 Tax=Ekhidna sp. MALMAid0563 TaxID=3143937 RepID=UPI0032DFDF1E
MNKTIYFLIVMLSCSMSDQQSSGVISAEKLIELKAEGIKVVDIRTKGEYDQGHIPGVIHIDFLGDGFLERMKKEGTSEPIIIHCASGGRSAKAAKILKETGFERVYDYSGGFKEWSAKGLEIER